MHCIISTFVVAFEINIYLYVYQITIHCVSKNQIAAINMTSPIHNVH